MVTGAAAKTITREPNTINKPADPKVEMRVGVEALNSSLTATVTAK